MTEAKNKDIVQKTVSFVQAQLEGAEAGHDWWHIQRVWNNVKLILTQVPADTLVCELAALLHDIADSKFHDGDEELGPRLAAEFLTSLGMDAKLVSHVKNIIKYMSYRSSLEDTPFRSIELEVVQDADRLDAIGAIGIARAFHYGGYKNRPLYDPATPFESNLTKDYYTKSASPTINHFYEKLLLLKDKMNTAVAKEIATERHQYMEGFLAQFYTEWNGER